MNTLHIFDFDDTLIRSDAKVVVINKSGQKKELTSEEYATYVEQPGDVFDFNEFERYPKNAEIIKPVFEELKKSIASASPDNVVILTARANAVPVQIFLKINKLQGIHVEAVGSSDPMSKASYIMNRLKDDPAIEKVRVFEDNVRNIRTIRKVMKDTGIVLKTNRVQNGSLT